MGARRTSTAAGAAPAYKNGAAPATASMEEYQIGGRKPARVVLSRANLHVAGWMAA